VEGPHNHNVHLRLKKTDDSYHDVRFKVYVASDPLPSTVIPSAPAEVVRSFGRFWLAAMEGKGYINPVRRYDLVDVRAADLKRFLAETPRSNIFMLPLVRPSAPTDAAISALVSGGSSAAASSSRDAGHIGGSSGAVDWEMEEKYHHEFGCEGCEGGAAGR
jgi:hypothetical protein